MLKHGRALAIMAIYWILISLNLRVTTLGTKVAFLLWVLNLDSRACVQMGSRKMNSI